LESKGKIFEQALDRMEKSEPPPVRALSIFNKKPAVSQQNTYNIGTWPFIETEL
jgi:hypothetical protein